MREMGKVCVHCGATLSLAALVKPGEDGYEYVCESCAVAMREEAPVQPSKRG